MRIGADSAKSIFLEAVEHHPPEEWPAYLDRACPGDDELRRAVELLLRAHAEPGGPVDRLEPEPGLMDAHATVCECPGTVIGPYKLREQIGEGGMGVVYVAEQTQPVRRKVALKIIKPGMDTKQVVA